MNLAHPFLELYVYVHLPVEAGGNGKGKHQVRNGLGLFLMARRIGEEGTMAIDRGKDNGKRVALVCLREALSRPVRNGHGTVGLMAQSVPESSDGVALPPCTLVGMMVCVGAEKEGFPSSREVTHAD